MFNPSAFLKKWIATSTPRQKGTAALLAFSLLATGAFFVLSGSSGTSNSPLGSTPFYFLGVFIKLVGVLLLIVASAIIFRRYSNFSPTGSRVRHLHLLETVRLSPKQSLHLVAIGNQHILIGATDQTIALITPVESSPDFSPIESSKPQPAMDFASLLRAFNVRTPSDSTIENE